MWKWNNVQLWFFLAGIFAFSACSSKLPDPSSQEYREVVSAFYVGVAAMEVGEDQRAIAKLTDVTLHAPGEPAGWANLALLALRRGEYDIAESHLQKALNIDDDNGYLHYLVGQLELLRDNQETAVVSLRSAVERDSTHLRAAYLLYEQLSLLDGAGMETGQLLESMTAIAPDNIALLLMQIQRAADSQDAAALKMVTERLSTHATTWGQEAVQQLDVLMRAVAEGDVAPVASQAAFLRNVLLSEPAYRKDLAVLRAPVEVIASPLTGFVRLSASRSVPAAPDDSMTFVSEDLLLEDRAPQAWIGAVALGNAGLPAVFFADGTEIRTLRDESWSFPGYPSGPYAVAGMDYDYDFRTDLVLAGPEGLRLLGQDSTEAFYDVTATLGLQRAITEASYTGAWVADLDLEGDVDLVLAAASGAVQTLRNNGDGTFAPMAIFDDLPGLRNFLWADLDGDGDPDATLLDTEGRVHLMDNERQGRFRPWPLPQLPQAIADIFATDSNSDGIIDLLALRADGVVLRFSWIDLSWRVEELAQAEAPQGMDAWTRLLAVDIDNNGAVDMLLTGPQTFQVWLQNEEYVFEPLSSALDAHVFAVASIRQAGQLDLLGLDADGQPIRIAALTTKGYHWKQIHPRAAQAVGDQRINTFGIGGEVELRSGALYQKQPITHPVLHFGLGTELLADVARITWPNGTVQAEFEMLSDQVVSAQQRLKGSCPWLFTFDGEQITFVTDFIWRSPLGLRINAQETAGIMTTEDWVKIRGDQLQPRDGQYDVRITAELWETHFFDEIALMVVDHPAETEIYVDERFAFPPPTPAVFTTQPPQAVRQVWDDQGNDVTAVVRAKDEEYLDFFGRGDYQGITRDHYTEIDLGSSVPEASFLLASGWIRPTDSSINVAISQGTQAPPRDLRLEVLDADGTWQPTYDGLGFPSGKAKTILVDLEGIFPPGAPRRVRLHTNMEIYWDAFAWAAKELYADVKTQRLSPEVAELQYRGYSVVHEASKSSPELPDYNTLATTVPIWRDLVGYHTRFGDVRPLLQEVDDRYVIMNAGDEMLLRFTELPPPPQGWQRDFVLIGDGWVKDGDYNTTFSKTVLPLPSHAIPTYDQAPGTLQDDPVYREHAEDWQTYHTRYVSPEQFRQGIYLPKNPAE